MRVMLAMLGARRRYLVPEVMEELGVLACFVTDVFVGRHGRLRTAIALVGRWLRIKRLRSLAGRSSPHVPGRRIVSFQWLGIRYAVARFSRGGDARLFAAFNRKFCLKAVPYLRSADICWAYNGAAQELFEAARPRNIRCVLEQVIAPRHEERRELEEAEKDWPQWSFPEDLKSPILADPLLLRERAEWQLADMIVVGSRYVQGCLERAGVATSRFRIVPSGIDLEEFKVGVEIERDGPLRVLCVGQISLRKGVPYLLEAVRRLNSPRIQLRLIGSPQIPRECISAYARWASFMGSVPLSEIAAHYQWADILVAPSVCEGSAMVTYEARGCGVPILATPNAGAFFLPGIDGLEIPVRDADAIAKTLERLARDRDEVRTLRDGVLANRHLLGREAYRNRIRDVLESVGGLSLREMPRNTKCPT